MRRHSPLSSADRLYSCAALAICVGTLALNLHSSAHNVRLSPDAAHHAVLARNLVRGQGFTIDFVPFHLGFLPEVRHVPEMHGMVRPLLLAPLFAMRGPDSEALRIPGLVCVAASAFLAFLFARQVFGPAAGLAACLLTAASAKLYRWGASGLDDAEFALCFLLVAMLLHRALLRGGPRAFAYAGIGAGAALLSKGLGIVMPGLLLAVFARRPRPSARFVVRSALWFMLPFVACFALVVLRNVLAHGGPGFRFSALEWIWKTQGTVGWSALYELPPSIGEVLRELGWRQVAHIQWEQFARFADFGFRWWEHDGARQVTDPGVLLTLGLLAGAVHFRRHREFSVILALSLLVPVTFVSLLAHFESRYFTYLTPLLAVSLAGCVEVGRGKSPYSRFGPHVWLRAAAIVIVLVVAAQSVVAYGQARRPRRWPPDPCTRAIKWVQQSTGPDEAVIVYSAAAMAWRLDRPTVQPPSNGVEPVRSVSRHYGVRWMIATARPIHQFTRDAIAALSESGELRVAPGFERARCRVYRLQLAEGPQ